MKVLIIGVEQVKKEERFMDEKGWSFQNAFERLGVISENFFYKKKGRFAFIEKNKGIKDIWRSIMNRSLVSHVKRTAPDLLFISKGETITPETLWEIRKKTDTVIVTVFPDNPIYMGKFEAIEPCHHFFVKDTYVRDTLWKAGLKNVRYLPQCTDPAVHRPVGLTEDEKAEYGTDVSLIGSMYPYRLKFVEELLDFNPVLWGKGWSRSGSQKILQLYRGRDIRGNQKTKAICGTKISLNPHHPLNDICGVNRRTYDLAACRGFQLADYKPDMKDLLKINEEIVCFRTIDELKKLIRYYLSHPDERAQLAEAAYQRVLKDHTYYNRAREILDIIKNSTPT
jgi:spore maturation protein CgeB